MIAGYYRCRIQPHAIHLQTLPTCEWRTSQPYEDAECKLGLPGLCRHQCTRCVPLL